MKFPKKIADKLTWKIVKLIFMEVKSSLFHRSIVKTLEEDLVNSLLKKRTK